ncbi:MAG TPA: hypothetical protein VIY48_05120 [Candidatus Paceibacterota bacterium]
MKRKDLIELYHQIEETHLERKRLGEFDANSKHMMAILDGLLTLTQHAIESLPPEGRGKKK